MYVIFVLKNPVDGSSQLIEKEQCRAKTKRQASVYVVLVSPTYSKEVPVLWSYWDKAERIL